MTDLYRPPAVCPECGGQAAVEHAVEDFDGESVFLRTLGVCVSCGILWRIGSQSLRVLKDTSVNV